MFSKKIVESDIFLDMPLSAQALYFHLAMEADDDGFVNKPRKIQRMLGASDDDLKILFAKEFLISFENGVVVVKHWKIHNYIRGDRKKATIYQKEAALLEVNSNNEYKLSKEIPVLEIPTMEIPAAFNKEEEKEETLRQQAYAESPLPYSFNYKIRHYFYGKKCPVCGVRMTNAGNSNKPSIQHNIPISKGGKHELGNISVMCLGCNTSIRDKITGDLNSDEVCEAWDRIVEAEERGEDWFRNPSILGALDECQSNDSQVSVSCPSNDGVGKVRLGKVSIGKVSIGKDSIGKDSIGKDRLEEVSVGEVSYIDVLSESSIEPPKPPKPPKPPEPSEPKNRIRYQDIADMYNSICVSLPKLKTFSDGRKGAVKKIIDKYGLEKLKQCFEIAEENDFLSGRKTNWGADFDWLTKPANFVKVIDGNYTERNQTQSVVKNDYLYMDNIDWMNQQGVDDG